MATRWTNLLKVPAALDNFLSLLGIRLRKYRQATTPVPLVHTRCFPHKVERKTREERCTYGSYTYSFRHDTKHRLRRGVEVISFVHNVVVGRRRYMYVYLVQVTERAREVRIYIGSSMQEQRLLRLPRRVRFFLDNEQLI